MSARVIELLYFDGCPNVDEALARVKAATSSCAEGDVTIRLVKVDTDEDAKRASFLGSPSVRVDGLDVEAAARARTDFGLQCRVYPAEGRMQGAPPIAWIEATMRGEQAGVEAARAESAGACCQKP